ncbi:hypothetical protein NQ317_002033 [Molorchus minor]|uniref:Uncharacterized protein n=1 Tax=Molorchus minor TaxID=1323400 RepID=A0ABQ9JJ16_9CUCU|nr:hypothetical protein NQ317_002033 [Molorchus minor]
MNISTLCVMLILYIPSTTRGQRLVPPRHLGDDEDDHADYADDDNEEEHIPANITDQKGLYVGAACDVTCHPKLSHAYCNSVSKTCECEKKYPVKLNNPYAGCSKPKRLGDQCYYKEACEYTDQHASCVQVHHNAVCQCKNGYHSVSIQKPSKKVFCAEADAPINDLQPWKRLKSYEAIDSEIDAAARGEAREGMLTAGYHLIRGNSAKLSTEATLKAFTEHRKRPIIYIKDSFLQLPPDQGKRNLRMVNDTEERGVKLFEDYNTMLTKNEKQCLLHVGEQNRKNQIPIDEQLSVLDVAVIASDFSTFAGVLSGIAVLSGLICFVLHLFNKNLYGSHHRHRFGNANLAPPILFSSDPVLSPSIGVPEMVPQDANAFQSLVNFSTIKHEERSFVFLFTDPAYWVIFCPKGVGTVPGSLPLPIIDRSLTSRASSHRTFASMPSRRASSAPGCRGISVSASRAGAARTAAILLLSYCHGGPYEVSCRGRADTKLGIDVFRLHCTLSVCQALNTVTTVNIFSGSRRPSIASVHSLSSIRSYSTRRYERERQQKEEREMERRYSRMTAANSTTRVAPTPSPHSTDDLLPTLEEDKQVRFDWYQNNIVLIFHDNNCNKDIT